MHYLTNVPEHPGRLAFMKLAKRCNLRSAPFILKNCVTYGARLEQAIAWQTELPKLLTHLRTVVLVGRNSTPAREVSDAELYDAAHGILGLKVRFPQLELELGHRQAGDMVWPEVFELSRQLASWEGRHRKRLARAAEAKGAAIVKA